MSTTFATDSQIATIRARRVDAVARAMMTDGVTLSHEQADGLGDDGLDWIRTRLGLSVSETDRGVECTPVVSVGDRVETVGLTDEDSDTGRVIAIDGDIATVAWASGVRTACAVESLRTGEVAS